MNFDHQIDVAAFGLVVHARTKQRDLRPLPQHGLRRAFDGVNLGGGQAHGVRCF